MPKVVLVVTSTTDDGPTTKAIGPMPGAEAMQLRNNLLNRKLIISAHLLETLSKTNWQTWRSRWGKEG